MLETESKALIYKFLKHSKKQFHNSEIRNSCDNRKFLLIFIYFQTLHRRDCVSQNLFLQIAI